ncbi:LacI family DNA-binding transcriptional regulator [Nocardioides sp. MAH-18]|uniref:LacI family DNA-binding transcriptional regulator n=1 Tax=Nocardioides agri TaxID=2682843 RepID=A0A6L6XSC5_9ACTN|nr:MULTISPECIES: LacI family DNA-binding transcriptional regulator [unclassified Nocardioides]MBA2955258.1 LacI family DNA-binding transcriptional regulator [Nocardioides sp. CGMCC 1.13656]MVQ50109.1 LacI family DNA-binding transcriptional regulator [Nocardioides sp. MAH-18]
MGATMQDVALAAGVSIKTVSNVINDYPYVRPATRERVLAAIDQLAYRPNLSARGLRSGKTGIIGLAVPELRENYFAELADAVIRAAEKSGLGVVVEQTNGDRESELRVLSRARTHYMDGILLSPVGMGQADASLLDVPFPLVLLGERIFGGPVDHVTMHNVSSAGAAVEHLLSIGRRRIALVGAEGDDVSDASSWSLRVRGYRRALEQAGIPVDEHLVRRTEHWSRAGGAAALHELIDEGHDFDAVFALNDALALGVLRGLQEAGRRVPDDVAVVGFDNVDEGQFAVPSLTTVDPGREEIARTAVALLVERINEKGTKAPARTMKAEFSIVSRESTGGADAPRVAQ